jgi:putative molybdopterin biosynthesis protein
MGGLEAVRRGECDLAGIHLLDDRTNVYNRPFLGPDMMLIPGYRRMQGVVFRRGDKRLTDGKLDRLTEANCLMINRNRGSGTRILIDELLKGARPAGYSTEVRSHNAVVAAVAQGRADWGVAIETAARAEALGFIPLREEHFDFVVPKDRWERPAVQAFREILGSETARAHLRELGFQV